MLGIAARALSNNLNNLNKLSLFSIAKPLVLHNLKKGFPYKLTFAVTYACNSRCSTCYIWKTPPRNELSTEQITKFLSQYKFPWVNLTGGEPFLRKGLDAIIKQASENADIVNLTTNGLLTKHILDTVKNVLPFPKRLIITVSIDGPKPVYKRIRGVDGFEKAVSTFKALRELSAEHKNLSTFIGYTISKFNIGMLEETYEAVKKYIPDLEKKEFHLNFYHESDFYLKNRGSGQVSRIKTAEKEIDWVRDTKKGFSPLNFMERKYLEYLKDYLKTSKTPLPCKALDSSVFIDPSGNVYPCTIFERKLGNIQEQGLEDILKSKIAKETRELIKNQQCPHCWTPCEAYQIIAGNLRRALWK